MLTILALLFFLWLAVRYDRGTYSIKIEGGK